MAILENGRETLDQTPVAYPIKFQRPTPIHIRIRNMILAQMEESRSYTEYDTAEEADNFDLGDDDMPDSPYTLEDDFDHIYDEKWSKGGAGGKTPDKASEPDNQVVPPAEPKPNQENK